MSWPGKRAVRVFPGTARGRVSFDPPAAGERPLRGESGSLVEELSSRELEILTLISEGLSNDDTAKPAFNPWVW